MDFWQQQKPWEENLQGVSEQMDKLSNFLNRN
jgi:hypothetical protein